jgi:hypothetical protein
VAEDRDGEPALEPGCSVVIALLNPHIAAHNWDKDTSPEELATRLGNLKRQASKLSAHPRR